MDIKTNNVTVLRGIFAMAPIKNIVFTTNDTFFYTEDFQCEWYQLPPYVQQYWIDLSVKLFGESNTIPTYKPSDYNPQDYGGESPLPRRPLDPWKIG